MEPEAVPGSPRCSGVAEDVRGEAARLESRLAVARDRLGALVSPCPLSARAAPRAGVARFDDNDDDDNDNDNHVDPDLRQLLSPAASRITQLLELAGSLADGTAADAEVAEAARALADAQPHRRSR